MRVSVAVSFVHLVARAHVGFSPFDDRDAAKWFWRKLRGAWPNALAACLMPNHVHLIVATAQPRRERRKLCGIASGFTRHVGSQRIWAELPGAETIPDASHLARTIRYVHLNPCRARIVADPLEWAYSTHRGVIGAELDPWVVPERVADAIGWSHHDFPPRFHGFVSGDPSTNVAGTPFPKPTPPQRWPAFPLETVIARRWLQRLGHHVPSGVGSRRCWLSIRVGATHAWSAAP